MPLHMAERLHDFVLGLFRPSDKQEAQMLHADLMERFTAVGLDDVAGRKAFLKVITSEVITVLKLPPDHPEHPFILGFASHLLYYEQLFILPSIDWSERRSISEYWRLRDELIKQKNLVENFDANCEALVVTIAHFFQAVYEAAPLLLTDSTNQSDISISTDLRYSLGNIGDLTTDLIKISFATDNVLTQLQDRLERNLVAASGGNPAYPKEFTRALKMPTQFEAKDPSKVVDTYLEGTPLWHLLTRTVPCTIPTATRFEHHHIIAGSGHGKTQTLQYLIAEDIRVMENEKRSVVVLDSQGDLIRNISNLAVFAPGGPLHDRIVIIDPTDVEWPVSLNLFDVGIERLNHYAPLERERLTNSILELYDFVLGSLLSAEMTQKQNVIFRYVTRLMLHIPDATIHTLRELMEPDSDKAFAEHIAKLTGTARTFFATEFGSSEFRQTKKQVLRRLWGILENQTFERMFSHPRSKLDLFAEMNAGKVILINTAKDLLKEQGTEIFGRFFIAMIAQAAQERATLPKELRTTTSVYIDEVADYVDRNIGIILAQARKYHVGMVLAHQFLGQLDPKLQEAFAANTSIKFAGGVSAKDARALSSMLSCEPGLIEQQPKGSFAAQIRGVTKGAIPLSFPFGHLERQPQMNEDARRALQEEMRRRYAVHYTDLAGHQHMETKAAADDAENQLPASEPTTPKAASSSENDLSTDAGTTW